MNSIRIKTAIALCFVFLIGACAPLTKVTLLPQADGAASAVLVTSSKSEQLLNVPYQQAIGQEDKALKAATTTAAAGQVQRQQDLAAFTPGPLDRAGTGNPPPAGGGS